MVTTVSVSEDTHRKMMKVKEEKGSSSFDELLEEVMDEELDLPDSLMGEAEFTGSKDDLRDRSDRADRIRGEE